MFGQILSGFETQLFDEFRRLESELDQLVGRGGAWPTGIRAVRRGTFPPINVGSTADRVDVYVFASGIDPKALDISIQQNLLVISGQRAVRVAQEGNYYRRERYDGEFRRVITLPEDVDPERVDAKYRDGVLQITVRRRESAQPRQIAVS
jgi:HSP20 family protein